MPGLPELEIICIDVEKHERRPQREKLEPHVNPDVLECHGAPPCCDRAAYSRRADPLLCRGSTDGPSFLSHWPRLLQCVRDQNIGPYPDGLSAIRGSYGQSPGVTGKSVLPLSGGPFQKPPSVDRVSFSSEDSCRMADKIQCAT